MTLPFNTVPYPYSEGWMAREERQRIVREASEYFIEADARRCLAQLHIRRWQKELRYLRQDVSDHNKAMLFLEENHPDAYCDLVEL